MSYCESRSAVSSLYRGVIFIAFLLVNMVGNGVQISTFTSVQCRPPIYRADYEVSFTPPEGLQWASTNNERDRRLAGRLLIQLDC